jgi:hypothetical protein
MKTAPSFQLWEKLGRHTAGAGQGKAVGGPNDAPSSLLFSRLGDLSARRTHTSLINASN